MAKIVLSESQVKTLIAELFSDYNINKIVEDEQPKGTPLLRTMTKKSKFTFGKYVGQTVEEVLRLSKRAYLRTMYYNIEGISFTDDILEEIGIKGEKYDDRIKKPGKDPELGEKINEKISGSKLKSTKGQRIHKGRQLGKYMQHKKEDEHIFSKSALSRYNHGHR